MMFLKYRGIKPTVPASMRGACIWVSNRLMMPVEDLEQNSLIPAIGATLSETKTMNLTTKKVVSVDQVKRMEHFMTREKPMEILFLGVFLIQIMASLRFDDLLHTAPELVTLVAGALLGVAWQTKVDRRRRGTKWAESRGSFLSLIHI